MKSYRGHVRTAAKGRKTGAVRSRKASWGAGRSRPAALPTSESLDRTEALNLQRTAGNSAVDMLVHKGDVAESTVVQRAAPADAAVVTPEADMLDAQVYIDNFYEGVREGAELLAKCRDIGIESFKDVTKLPSPPDIASEVALALMGVVLGEIPGWSILVEGLTTGVFGKEWAALMADLGKEGGEKLTKGLEKGGEFVKSGFEKGHEAAEKGAAASEDAKAAGELRELRVKSVSDWASAIARASDEKHQADAWLRTMRTRPVMRGKLATTIAARLGPIPGFKPNEAKELVERAAGQYELALYKEKFKGTGEHVIHEHVDKLDRRWIDRKWIDGINRPILVQISRLKGWPIAPYKGGASGAPESGPQQITMDLDADALGQFLELPDRRDVTVEAKQAKFQ